MDMETYRVYYGVAVSAETTGTEHRIDGADMGISHP